MSKVTATTPVGRIVTGSLYDPQTTDGDGKPLVIKNGPNAGQPRVNYFFALAIAKGSETHWSQTEWGAKIWAIGHAAFPAAAQSPSFAWKVDDGDSVIPNTKGKKPCDNEGWRGHWVIKFSGGFAPKIYRAENGGFVQIVDKDAVKCGYYAEVFFNCEGNLSQSKPGVYLNHQMVCMRAYGTEIVTGPDVSAAGFGAAPLPQGASMTPPVSTMPPVAAPAVPVAAPAPLAPPATPVVPNVTFAQVPAPKQMTAAATATYEAYIAAGWTDVQLIQNGLMVA